MGKKIIGSKKQKARDRITSVKKALFLVVLFVLVAVPITVGASLLDQKRAELSRLQGQIDNAENKVESYSNQADTLKNQIALMNSQISQLKLRIKLTQTKIEETNLAIGKLTDQISQKRKELAEQEEILGQAIKYIYEEGETPFIETLFSSITFSEILDRTEYLETAEMKIEKTMAEIERLKKELEGKKAEQEKKRKELQKLNQDLNLQRQELEQDRMVKDRLLTETENNEAIYQKKLSSLAQKQQAIVRWIGAHISYSDGCESGCGSQIYCQPQCVTYVARIVGVSYGNGGDWARYGDYNPQKGDVMSWPAYTGGAGRFGHVAYVESVGPGRDPMITISQTNWGCNCCRSTMTFHKSAFPAARYIHF